MTPSLGKAVAWMMGALVSFATLAVSLRAMSHDLTVFEMLALRNIGGIVLIGGYALLRARGDIGAPRPLWIHLVRNVFHFGGQAAWTTGLTLLPIATVFALEFTTPAWTVVLAVLFLGERATSGRLAAVGLGFLGVLIILRPGVAAFDPNGLIVLFAAVMFSVQLTTTKQLTRTNTVLNIMLWMNLMQLPMYLAAAALTGRAPLIFPYLHWADLPAVLAICTAGLSAHVCLTSAFRHGDAIMVVPMDFLRVPLIAVVGALLYGERFDLFVLLGAAVTAAGILFNLRQEMGRR
jgi:drug/metabolite transporter (DMT)-like permease